MIRAGVVDDESQFSFKHLADAPPPMTMVKKQKPMAVEGEVWNGRGYIVFVPVIFGHTVVVVVSGRNCEISCVSSSFCFLLVFPSPNGEARKTQTNMNWEAVRAQWTRSHPAR